MKRNKKAWNLSLFHDLTKQTNDEINKMDKIHILLVGKTGVGKSTLINHLFREELAKTGIGQPITQHIRQITKEGMPLVLYDTRGLELTANVQQQVRQEIQGMEEKLAKKGGQMHCAYYCVNANSMRVEANEVEFIKELAQRMPVILVLTLAIGEAVEDFKTAIEEMNLPVQGVIPVLAKDYPLQSGQALPAFGLKALIRLTLQVVPENVWPSFTNAQQADIDRKVAEAKRWAKRYIATTFGIGFTPIPFSDATAIVPVQISMLAHITAVFGVSLEKKTLLGIIGAIGGTTGATFLGRSIVSNLLKFLPGVGSFFGGVISGGTASLLTSALAMSYITVLAIISEHEARGERLSSRSIARLMRRELKARLKRGKKDEDFKDIKQEQEGKK